MSLSPIEVTDAQNAYNLRTVARQVRERLRYVPATATYQQAIAYNKALAAEILKYSMSFNSQTITTAEAIIDKSYDSGLDDPSLDWGLLRNEIADSVISAGGAAAGVGSGVLTTVNAARWALPVAVAFLLGVLLYRFATKPTSPA